MFLGTSKLEKQPPIIILLQYLMNNIVLAIVFMREKNIMM